MRSNSANIKEKDSGTHTIHISTICAVRFVPQHVAIALGLPHHRRAICVIVAVGVVVVVVVWLAVTEFARLWLALVRTDLFVDLLDDNGMMFLFVVVSKWLMNVLVRLLRRTVICCVESGVGGVVPSLLVLARGNSG